MKRKECDSAINCDSDYGPIFGDDDSFDIYIGDDCNEEDSCSIDNDGTNKYECHPEYKASLFVNTAGPHCTNYFTVLDYEVYTH